MGRAHAVTAGADAKAAAGIPAGLARAAGAVVAAMLLAAAVPLMLVLALAVRRSSHGPVLRREPAVDHRGRPVTLLSFRTHVDGAHSDAHERLRAVVGGGSSHALTGPGRVMRATRTDRLPRLLNVVAGHVGLLRALGA